MPLVSPQATKPTPTPSHQSVKFVNLSNENLYTLIHLYTLWGLGKSKVNPRPMSQVPDIRAELKATAWSLRLGVLSARISTAATKIDDDISIIVENISLSQRKNQKQQPFLANHLRGKMFWNLFCWHFNLQILGVCEYRHGSVCERMKH